MQLPVNRLRQRLTVRVSLGNSQADIKLAVCIPPALGKVQVLTGKWQKGQDFKPEEQHVHDSTYIITSSLFAAWAIINIRDFLLLFVCKDRMRDEMQDLSVESHSSLKSIATSLQAEPIFCHFLLHTTISTEFAEAADNFRDKVVSLSVESP
jgi:hypothetical protein